MLYKEVLVFSSVTFNSKVAVNFKVSVATHVKATEQYFPMVLFIMLYKVVLTFESVVVIFKCDHSNVWLKSFSVTIQMKPTEQYFPRVQSIMLYKVVLTFDSVDKIPVCIYSNETELLSTRIPSSFCLLRSTRWFWKYKKCDQS